MANDRRNTRPRVVASRPLAVRRRSPGEARPATLDWPAWMALLERHRKRLARNGAFDASADDFFVEATCSSFRLEGIQISAQEVIDAITQGFAQRKFRSRTAQRIRNHVAILHSIAATLRESLPLKSAAVLRWYTSIASGLSTGALSVDTMRRLDQVVGRTNSPQLRLQPAIQEIARTYADLLTDPLFPSFNGILARLVLQFHLGRCGLPGVLPDASLGNGESIHGDGGALAMLIGIDERYQLILRGYEGA